MEAYLGEVLGTFLLMLLGNGVVANVVLNKTKGHDSGWIVITWGWGIAVFVAVFAVGSISGAHINPAVTLGLATVGKFSWSLVPGYIVAQLIGAFWGTSIVWLMYKDHYDETPDQEAKLATFSTIPAIRNNASNLLSEIIGTFVLVLAVLYIAEPEIGLGALSSLPVGLLVFGIGMGLGGTTGYAINPARDLGPRVAHSVLPIKGKGSSNWDYAWIPIVGPVIGAFIAAGVYIALGF
jgi:glycerol uptake facilitator protein